MPFDDLPSEQACLIGCAVATGVGSVLETARVWPGARVGVIGCAAQSDSASCRERSSRALRRCTRSTSTSASSRSRRFGATHAGPSSRLDFVFDVVGRPETVERALEMLGRAGTLVYIGLPHPDAHVDVALKRLFDRRLRLIVSHGGDHVPADDFPQLASLRTRRRARPRRDGDEDDRPRRREARVRGDARG